MILSNLANKQYIYKLNVSQVKILRHILIIPQPTQPHSHYSEQFKPYHTRQAYGRAAPHSFSSVSGRYYSVVGILIILNTFRRLRARAQKRNGRAFSVLRD